jgi:hypothetical protein
MSDINGLHDSLSATFHNWMRDIWVANESANYIAVGVKKLRLFFEGHEICTYNMQRMFVLGLTKHKDSMVWFY